MNESIIETPEVRQARYMHRDDHKHPVLVVLWNDNSITSCSFKSDTEKEVVCCHTELGTDNETFFAWLAHLASVGYKEEPIEVENEFKAGEEEARLKALEKGIIV